MEILKPAKHAVAELMCAACGCEFRVHISECSVSRLGVWAVRSISQMPGL